MISREIIAQLRTFVQERNWDQFHSPENLAKSISIEAGELLELFQWSSEADLTRVGEELADVLTYCILLSEKCGFDLENLVETKLIESRRKYPIDKSYGRSAKYDRL